MREGIHAVVWLDRDGTINRDPGYLSDPDRLELLPGVGEAVARLNAAGATLVVVSNQSGIGRGLLTEDDLERVNAELRRQLTVQGAHLDAIEHCPHLPPELLAPGQEPCSCRKPATGMVDRMRRRWSFDPGTPQVVVGDKRADLELARNAGCAAVLVLTGEGERTRRELSASGELGRLADHVADDLAAAVPWVLSRLGLAPDGDRC